MLDATQTKDAHIDARLRTDLILWLATVRPDGRPHLVPVWFLWDGATVLIFSQPNNQKVRNIQANPSVMLALDNTGSDGGDVVTLEGEAQLIDPREGITANTVQAYLAKYGQGITDIGLNPETMAATYSQGIRITPTRFL